MAIFKHSQVSNSKTNWSIWPNFKLMPDFMPILAISKFDKVLIKTKLLCPVQDYLHCNLMGKFFFPHSRVSNS